MKRSIVGLALALVLSVALSHGARAEKYYIDHEVWGWYQQYLRNIGHGHKPGAFAITKDGHNAFYSWCEDIRCVAGPTYSQDALNYCEREYGGECVVFAVRDDIKVEYEIVDSGAGDTSSNVDVTTPPAIRITASPDAQAKIEAYRHNARAPGRFWAFAIAKNGSDAASASCSTSGAWTGGLGISCPVAGVTQESANTEAIKRCGGPSDCILLYEGEKMATGVEIVDSSGAPVVSAPQVATTAPASSVAATPTKTAVRVSSALRDKVERYLDNSASFGNTYRFLAVNDAGDKIGTSNCVKMTTWMTDACGGAAGPYEGAKRVALNDCGGPDQCRLIFEGARKIGDFEIEWYGSDSSAVTPSKPVETQPSVKSAEPAPSAPMAVASAAPVVPAPVVPPKPSLKIAVSSAVQSDIESYLHNAHSTARLWAFAVAKNGSDGAMASCPAGGGWSGGGACEPVKGGPQELANREAIKKCGGPEDCVLLYVGEKKASDIEVISQ
jgi:hypothetical protein